MAVVDHNQTVKATPEQLDKLIGDNVLIIEYVRNRDDRINFWKIETVSDVELQYQIMLQMIELQKRSHWITTGSEEFITRVRLGVAKDEVKPGQIVFKYEDNLMFPNEYGRLDQWPRGFCDYSMDLSEQLMLIAMEKRKAVREAKSLVIGKGSDEAREADVP